MREVVPRRIISYWDKGFGSAPEMVQLCVESWRVSNPKWDLLLLNEESARQMFPSLFENEDFLRSPIQTRSDLIRLQAVTELGGVWMDATLFCAKPLDEIIPPSLPDGFLAVTCSPGKNRFIENYFLASVPGAAFPSEWQRRVERFLRWKTKEMPRRHKKKMKKFVPFFFTSKVGSTVWTNPLLSRLLGHPYLFVHFIASRMILTSPRWRGVFRRMPTLSAIEGIGLARSPGGAEKVRELLSGDVPGLWKLDWKDPQNFPVFWDMCQKTLQEKFLKR